jgi:hypothetical protein
MTDLRYATVTTERHSVVVSTWTEHDGAAWVKMTVDGRTLTMAPIELAAWYDCCDVPGPLHADDCPTLVGPADPDDDRLRIREAWQDLDEAPIPSRLSSETLRRLAILNPPDA